MTIQMIDIGVLGCGYVGQRLLTGREWGKASWYGVHQNDPNIAGNKVVFSWAVQSSWSNLPSHADWLIVTIPPVYKACEQELQRLTLWCEWMAENRPNLKRLIYISTTGVYGSGSGVWNEQSECVPNALGGQLRLVSEQVLQQYFQCTVLRCGGIYGPGSNIVERCYAGEPVFRGNKPVYRIHVDDLTGIIGAIVTRGIGDKGVTAATFNVVENGAASQDELLNWLMSQAKFKDVVGEGFLDDTERFRAKRLDADESNEDRIVSNMALAMKLGYQLRFATYQQGLVGFL
jgi:nucleoside-diphosphate-sugar epimerase